MRTYTRKDITNAYNAGREDERKTHAHLSELSDAIGSAESDPFHAIRRAMKFCESRGLERGTKRYEDAIDAYMVGYSNGLRNL